MLHTLTIPTVSSISPNKNRSFKRLPSSSPSPSPHPPLLIRFNTSHRENLRYLKALNIISPTTTTNRFFSPQTLDQLLNLVNFLKSKGFSDPNIQALAFSCPRVFSSKLNPMDIDPIFEFLSLELSASPDESRGLILRCPGILFSDVDYYLRPTLAFLRGELGLKKLTSPTTLNAHLLNTRAEKFVEKIKFFQGLGFSEEEVRSVCCRLPAIFGYSVENNLTPKVEYLVYEMGRSVDELKVFPQYFGFSLDNRIVPRHLHLKERGVSVPLQRMLLWSDQKFYSKWK